MSTERVVNQTITKKYFEALKVAKSEIESNDFTLKQWESRFKICDRTMTTLKNLGVVKNLSYGKSTIYEWNNKIPVSILLAKKVILENRRLQSGYKKNMTLNKSKKPVVKPIIKPIVKQVVKPIQVTKKVSDVGLIRKFLRWIY